MGSNIRVEMENYKHQTRLRSMLMELDTYHDLETETTDSKKLKDRVEIEWVF